MRGKKTRDPNKKLTTEQKKMASEGGGEDAGRFVFSGTGGRGKEGEEGGRNRSLKRLTTARGRVSLRGRALVFSPCTAREKRKKKSCVGLVSLTLSKRKILEKKKDGAFYHSDFIKRGERPLSRSI